MEKIYINDVDIETLGVDALRSYTVGGTPVENDYWQGRNRTYFITLSSKFGLKPITFELCYKANNRHDLLLQRSYVEAMLFGVSEILLPDGFYYRCMLDSISDGETLGQDENGLLMIVTYKLNGIQHEELKTVVGGTFTNNATMPQSDCSLSVTVSADADTYVLGSATFSNVKAGDVLEVDGIHKRILKNGAPTLIEGYFEFPYVVPGRNIFIAEDEITVKYYPCYF